jgi:hypothetical protein
LSAFRTLHDIAFPLFLHQILLGRSAGPLGRSRLAKLAEQLAHARLAGHIFKNERILSLFMTGARIKNIPFMEGQVVYIMAVNAFWIERSSGEWRLKLFMRY